MRSDLTCSGRSDAITILATFGGGDGLGRGHPGYWFALGAGRQKADVHQVRRGVTRANTQVTPAAAQQVTDNSVLQLRC